MRLETHEAGARSLLWHHDMHRAFKRSRPANSREKDVLIAGSVAALICTSLTHRQMMAHLHSWCLLLTSGCPPPSSAESPANRLWGSHDKLYKQ